MRNDILNRREEILVWVKENQPKAYMCRKLSCKPETLDSYLTKMGILYAGNQGRKGRSSGRKKTALEYASGNSVSSHKLKIKLIEEGIKSPSCEICLKEEWMGREIPLELHHIDGDRYNNNFDNLMILCPNCHAIQPNNSGAAIGTYV